MGRYIVSGLPPEAADGATAFTPALVRHAAGGWYAYKAGVTGRPGNTSVPIQFMDSTRPSPDLGDEALQGTSSSMYAPDEIYPNQYWTLPEPAYWPGAGMPVVIPDNAGRNNGERNMIPVPAEDLRQTYIAQSARLAMGVNNARQRDVRQGVRQLIRWPNRNVGNGLPDG